jgi:hypothetical protein
LYSLEKEIFVKMNRMAFLVILQMLFWILRTEAASDQITLTGLVKSLNGAISQYSVTNLSNSTTGNYSHDFFNNLDQSLGGFPDSIDPGGKKNTTLEILDFSQMVLPVM